jgi:ArsR family metal-binding transcriptional regulator
LGVNPKLLKYIASLEQLVVFPLLLGPEIKTTLITLYNNLAVSLEMEKNYDEAINICNNIIMNLD